MSAFKVSERSANNDIPIQVECSATCRASFRNGCAAVSIEIYRFRKELGIYSDYIIFNNIFIILNCDVKETERKGFFILEKYDSPLDLRMITLITLITLIMRRETETVATAIFNSFMRRSRSALTLRVKII